jgi:hypothetical protein
MCRRRVTGLDSSGALAARILCQSPRCTASASLSGTLRLRVAFNASGPGRLRAESDAGATSRKDGIAENVTRHGGGLGARPLPLAVQSPRRDAHCRLRLAVCIQVEPWAPASQSPCGRGPSHWHCQLGSLLVAGHGTPDGNGDGPGDDPPGQSDHAESPGGKSGVVVGVDPRSPAT